ncbi:hypothetical protein L226DRAFT_469036 [Lentinus tigrinus ALCF2SS1-7]|uniref:Uncharacterized protein n=1 Tax=Lentinus tigrinus ALCF2SS1-6 TaxID=1328759 RepID=A0A5C2S0A3_9APHY|nr:hypothetical protein L227DRAFT_565789 [Lentinus tigrinus ALCF2SS1-6]RPD71158.1 hypothetical protein L226DRAFT_469036 [Lentinus tigrinus ALCF2SS1-7]
MAQRVTDETLNTLFPVPSPAPSQQAPTRFPGIAPDSVAALQRTLKDNHVKWHIFFNFKRFHNHASHQLLAIYQLGANGPLIDAAYEKQVKTQRDAFKSPDRITHDNFHEHLGDEDYYEAYLSFFTDALLKKGASTTIEEYIFSPKANIEPPKPGRPPMQMVNRLLSGLLHPLIHTGYGAEFGLLGMFAEGLAQTAVHRVLAPALTPPSIMRYASAATFDAANAAMNRITSLFPSLILDQLHRVVQPSQPQRTKSVHALSLVARISKDDYYSYKTIALPPPANSEEDTSLERVLHLRGDALVKLMDDWTVDGTNAQEVENKIEELFWTNVTIYGIGGWGARKHSKTGKFNGDFFLVHLVTSVLFLPSLVAYLSPTSINILLRTYLLNTLALYVARGRPALPVADFFDSVTPTPSPPSDPPKPSDGTLNPENPTANAWLALVQSTVMHPDDHLCKLQRSLAHFASLYGSAPAGHLKELGVELDGAEKIDGSLFVRVAGLSMDRLGWMREGQEEQEWDFDAFYHD